jgi:hypothetical protein
MSGIGDIFRVRCVIFNGWHRRHLSCMRCIVFNGWHRHLSFPSSIPVSGLTPLSFCETGVISRITLRSLKPPYFRLKDTGNLITLTNSSTESVRCLHSCDDLDFFALPCESSFISSLLGEQQLYQPRKHFRILKMLSLFSAHSVRSAAPTSSKVFVPETFRIS